MWICSLKRIDVEFQDSSLCNRFVIVPLRSVALASSSYRISHSKALYYFTLTSQSKRSKHKKFLPFSCSFFLYLFPQTHTRLFLFHLESQKVCNSSSNSNKIMEQNEQHRKKNSFYFFYFVWVVCIYIWYKVPLFHRARVCF